MAKFLTGSLMRHVVTMSVSASVGMISVFLVDFVDLYFISLLGEAALAAAVGFAGTILYFVFSVTIGLMIAIGALVAERLGAGQAESARQIASSTLVIGAVASLIITAVIYVYIPDLLTLLGAEGQTHAYAVSYLSIVLPAMPVGTLGMMVSGLLRAHGDAKRSMIVTFWASGVNAVLDPVLIFGLDLGLDGAAYASSAARVAMTVAAIVPMIRHHGGFAPVRMSRLAMDTAAVCSIGVPALLTNIATPVGNGIMTRAIAPFGDSAVAGFSVAGRLTPLAFCLIFALSGAVGPIVGQNFGARRFDRVREAIWRGIQFTGAYTLVIWLILVLLAPVINSFFGLSGPGSQVIIWFAGAVTPLFFFSGVLFIANGSFNNLKRPLWSTMLNWGRNTIGLIPFVWLGGAWFGAPGVLVGHALGGVLFALLAYYLVRRLLDGYESGRIDPDARRRRIPLMRAKPDPPFTSPRG